MTIIRPLEEVLREHREFKPGWRVNDAETQPGVKVVNELENPRFGIVRRVVVCKDDGTPMFDQYEIEEGPVGPDGKRALSSGAIIAPFYVPRKGGAIYLGTIINIREVVKDSETGEQGKCKSLELPRGFSDFGENPDQTALRELGEETGKIAKRMVYIGMVNPNTRFYTTPGIRAYAAEVDPSIKSHLNPNANEQILRCDFTPYRKIKEKIGSGKIYCGLSLAGLCLMDAFLEKEY